MASLKNAERDSALIIQGDDMQAPIYGDDSDTESAWSQWGEDLKTSQAKGVIRVAKIPTSEDGTPNLTKKGQVQLMSVAHDHYDYDGLLEAIRQKFMKPGETICVRLTGMRQSGSNAGVVPFNRIIMVSRGFETVPVGNDNSQLGEVLAAMQRSQESQAAMLRDILGPQSQSPDRAKPQRDVIETITVLSAAFAPFIAPVITGLMNRPREKSDLVGLIDAMGKMQALAAGKAGGESDSDNDNSLGSIIKAVAPSGMQLLAALAQKNASAQPMQRPPSLPQAMSAAAGLVRDTTNVRPPIEIPPTQPAAPQEEPSMLAVLKPTLIQLVEMAEKNLDAAETAQLLSDMLPEEYDDQLYNLVSSPTAFARLKLLNSDIVKHDVWFEALRVELLKLYSNDSDAPLVS